MKQHKVEILLGVVSLFFFGLFIHGAVTYDLYAGYSDVVAKLSRGKKVERKPRSAGKFESVGGGQVLNNMDAVWVGPKGTAEIEFEDGSNVQLFEKTLIIVKRPFKKKEALEEIKDLFKEKEQPVQQQKLKVVAGRAEEKNKTLTPEERRIKFEARAKKVQGLTKVYPGNKSTVFTARNDRELVFSWPAAISGTLGIRDLESGKIEYYNVNDRRFAQVKLDRFSSYSWLVVDVDKKPVIGPYRFSLVHSKKFKSKADKMAFFRRELFQEGRRNGVDVYW